MDVAVLHILSRPFEPSSLPPRPFNVPPLPRTQPILTLQGGWTLLHIAADGHLAMIRLLLDRGADKEAIDCVSEEGKFR